MVISSEPSRALSPSDFSNRSSPSGPSARTSRKFPHARPAATEGLRTIRTCSRLRKTKHTSRTASTFGGVDRRGITLCSSRKGLAVGSRGHLHTRPFRRAHEGSEFHQSLVKSPTRGVRRIVSAVCQSHVAPWRWIARLSEQPAQHPLRVRLDNRQPAIECLRKHRPRIYRRRPVVRSTLSIIRKPPHANPPECGLICAGSVLGCNSRAPPIP